ncbi:MAG: amino acid/polyamine/organocation transporter, superfamily [Actinomycetia bacterium]|nr:amino acid/polyamine/organocation transporter, superfamily [Actinomycetes bacterium]
MTIESERVNGDAGETGTSDADRNRLHDMGYAQELNRRMGWFSNFAISFSIISILAGAMTTYWLGMQAGGPRAIMLSWIIVGFFALLVGMAMAEICSTYPTAGGLYYWSAKLARRNGPRWSWYTGWFNLLGLIGVIASVDFALATFTGFFIQLYRPGFEISGSSGARNIFIIFVIYLAVHGLLNTFRVDLVALLGDISVWWHVVGVLVIFAVLFIAPAHHQSVHFLTEGKNLTGWSGPFAGIYVFGLGLLLAQYTITGFDASAHVSEETHSAHTEAPKAIVRAIYVSAIAAFVLNLAMTLAIPKGNFDASTPMYNHIAFTGINAAPELIRIAVGGAGAKLLILISIVGQFFCGMASVTAASRMIYAFSRDGAVPGHRVWHRINPKTRTPTNSVWLAVVLSAIVGASSLYQNKGVSIAFFAMTGICVVGLYIAYIIPVFLRLRNPNFVQGEWNLGRYSQVVGWAAVVWVIFVSLYFFAPVYPVLGFLRAHQYRDFANNFNWSGPLILLSFIAVTIWWFTSAKNWFNGPIVQGSKDELMAIERALDSGDVQTFEQIERVEEERLEETLGHDH